VEGFYGKPWTLPERMDMFAFMKENSLNTYIYAPKDDPYHRFKWAEPYPTELLREFQTLVDCANEHGITFTYAISPGLDIDYYSDQDFARLVEKCTYLRNIGVKAFGLFLDDIPSPPTVELAEAQSHLGNRLYEALNLEGETLLVFCPTKYQGDGNHPYVHRLGELLHRQVEIMWTGMYVCSPRISAEETRKLSEILRRPVFYWDNYPVNDGSMRAELHIGPYINRDPRLYTACSGIVLNPMPLVESSKVGIGTASAYMRDPLNYNPERAWITILQEMTGEGWAAFYRFAQGNLVSPLHPENPERIVEAVLEYRAGLNDFQFFEASSRMRAFFQEMADDVQVILASDTTLATEATPWLQEYKSWAELGQKAVLLMEGLFELSWGEQLSRENRVNKKKALSELRAQIGMDLKNNVDFSTKTCGEVVRNFGQDIYRATSNLEC